MKILIFKNIIIHIYLGKNIYKILSTYIYVIYPQNIDFTCYIPYITLSFNYSFVIILSNYTNCILRAYKIILCNFLYGKFCKWVHTSIIFTLPGSSRKNPSKKKGLKILEKNNSGWRYMICIIYLCNLGWDYHNLHYV